MAEIMNKDEDIFEEDEDFNGNEWNEEELYDWKEEDNLVPATLPRELVNYDRRKTVIEETAFQTTISQVVIQGNLVATKTDTLSSDGAYISGNYSLYNSSQHDMQDRIRLTKELYNQGHTQEQIAEKLGISQPTVSKDISKK